VELLLAVAALLEGLAGGQTLLTHTNAGLAEVGLEALEGGKVVVDESEAGGGSSSEGGLEAVEGDDVLVDLVHGGELVLDELVRHGTAPVGVGQLNDELAAAHQGVGEELRGANGELSLLLSGGHFVCASEGTRSTFQSIIQQSLTTLKHVSIETLFWCISYTSVQCSEKRTIKLRHNTF
jgi:hypothetical protein